MRPRKRNWKKKLICSNKLRMVFFTLESQIHTHHGCCELGCFHMKCIRQNLSPISQEIVKNKTVFWEKPKYVIFSKNNLCDHHFQIEFPHLFSLSFSRIFQFTACSANQPNQLVWEYASSQQPWNYSHIYQVQAYVLLK